MSIPLARKCSLTFTLPDGGVIVLSKLAYIGPIVGGGTGRAFVYMVGHSTYAVTQESSMAELEFNAISEGLVRALEQFLMDERNGERTALEP